MLPLGDAPQDSSLIPAAEAGLRPGGGEKADVSEGGPLDPESPIDQCIFVRLI